MSLEADLILRKSLRDQICRKQEKLRTIQRVLSRNDYECSMLRKRYHEVDRRIFESTQGISRVAIPIRSVHAKPKTVPLDHNFVASLSEAAAAKLAARLKIRIDELARQEAEKPLSSPPSVASPEPALAYDDIEDLKQLD
jgi:hypothetical protein